MPRVTACDVLRHPAWLRAWWEDVPARRRGWLRWLLFEPGQGWLRWGTDDRETWNGSYPFEPPEPYVVAPPLRRLWWWASSALALPSDERESFGQCWGNYRDDDRKRGSW